MSRRSESSIRSIKSFGKFEGNTVCDVYAYVCADDSTETESNEHWGNSATRVDFSKGYNYSDLRKFHQDNGYLEGNLNRAERRFILKHAGAIVHVSSQGFVSVDWFETEKSLDRQWSRVQTSYDPELIDQEESRDRDYE